LNKQYLSYFAAVLLAFLIIAPGIVAAEENTYKNIDAKTAKEMLKNNEVNLIDVRVENEFNAAHLKGAILIPVKKLGVPESFPEEVFITEVEKSGIMTDKPVIVYCLMGSRGQIASQYLADNEYTVYNVEGGIQAWIDAGYSVVSTFVDISGVDDCIKQALNAQINCVFVLLENGYDQEAKKRLDKFNCFVDKMTEINKIDDDQVYLLKSRSRIIRKMINNAFLFLF